MANRVNDFLCSSNTYLCAHNQDFITRIKLISSQSIFKTSCNKQPFNGRKSMNNGVVIWKELIVMYSGMTLVC